MNDTKRFLMCQATGQEIDHVDAAWKRTDDCLNRSQYIRRAINAYAGETIFEE